MQRLSVKAILIRLLFAFDASIFARLVIKRDAKVMITVNAPNRAETAVR